MISVLLPSRGRPALLQQSVESLRDNAWQPDKLDICVAYDHDEWETTGKTAARMLDEGLIHSIYSPGVRFGYAQLQRYYNALAEKSRGEWLMLWNDDATMQTHHWDWEIDSESEDAAALILEPKHNLSDSGFICFPIVRRALYKALGHYSGETPHVDSYLQDIGRALGRVRPVDIFIQHDRPDLVGAEHDQTFLEGRDALNHEHYFSPEFQQVIAESVERIRKAGI